MVPVLTGNLGVEHLMAVWAGQAPPEPGIHDRELDQWAELGVDGVEEYIAWGVCEGREGELDLSFPRAGLEAARRRGLRWVIYPWVHVLPGWWRERGGVTVFRCLEHDRECGWPSIFCPRTLAAYEHFYGGLARELGDAPDGICVAIPADYGEVAYPTGWGNWVAPLPGGLDHLHEGFWAGDLEARAAFRRFAAAGHDDPASIGAHLDLSLSSLEDLQPPGASDSATFRRAFAGFYLASMTEFVDRALGVVRAHFPSTPLAIKVGHGGESLHYGIDPTPLAKVAARHGAAIRTTQATLLEIHQKRISAPCRFHGVDLESEPPVDIGRELALGRVFADAGAGVKVFFDYPEHLIGARDLFVPARSAMTGEAARQDVALCFASAELREDPAVGFPPVLHDLSEELRDRFDYIVLDEALIEAGALEGIGVLALTEGREFPLAMQRAVLEFVEGGGWLVVGPGVECAGPLGERLLRAAAADDAVELWGSAGSSRVLELGRASDRAHLAGSWFPREDAGQFRNTPHRDQWCRWTGARASAFLPVDPEREHLLEIECWVHPRTVERRHEVLIGDTPLGPVTRAGLQRWAHWVPRAALNGSAVVELCFESETFRPCDLGVGEDERELGMNVLWLRVTQEGAPAGEQIELPVRIEARRLDGVADDELGERSGAGRFLVSRRRPYGRFIELLEQAARLRSEVQRGWFATEGRVKGVRACVFERRALLWNRTPGPVRLGWPDARPEWLSLEAGTLGEVEWVG